MRLNAIPPDRCRSAIGFSGLTTRCMFRRGHNGPHEGKAEKKNPYQRWRWQQNNESAFITDRKNEWAWRERKKA